MYRLSSYQDSFLQKLISRGITEVLIDMYSEEDGLTNERVWSEEQVKFMLQDTPLAEKEDGAWYQYLMMKIQAMVQECRDTENEYTFDELGEYLLYKALKEIYLTEEDEWLRGDNSVPFWPRIYWRLEISKEEILKLHEAAMQYVTFTAQSLIKDLEEQTPEEYACEIINDYNGMMRRVLFPPLLYREFEDDFGSNNFIAWDSDCTLIEELGLEKWQEIVDKGGEKLGLIDGSGKQELISGSLKVPLNRLEDV